VPVIEQYALLNPHSAALQSWVHQLSASSLYCYYAKAVWQSRGKNDTCANKSI